MDDVKGILLSLGIDEQSIIQESFGGKSVSAQTDTKEECAGGVIEFTRPNRTWTYLLGTVEMNDIHIPLGCRQGQCGTCATRWSARSGWTEKMASILL